MGTGIHPDVERVLYTADQIDGTVASLADRINRDYEGRKLLVIAILKGACVFMTDLVRKLDVDVEFDFMIVSSYGSASKTSGVVRILKDSDIDISGRDVLIVEDVVDSGLTLKYLHKKLESRHPASLEAAVLLRKDVGSELQFVPKYLGLEVPNEFIVGYGLDYAERYRNLPYIGVLDPKVYS